MPLVLHFVSRAVHKSSPNSVLVGLAVSYALLISTHLFTTLLFSPVLLASSVLVTEAKDRAGAMGRVAVALVLGIGLSASGRAEEDNLVRSILFQRVEQSG